MSTTTTVYGGTADGFVRSYNTTYATARTGSNLSYDDTGVNLVVGQLYHTNSTYYVWENFLSFDTGTPIPDTDIVETATLSLYGLTDYTDASDFVVEARTHSWTTSGLGTDDWVAGASLSGKTLLASFDTLNFVTPNYNVFVSEAAFVDAISLTGLTEILLSSSRQRVGDTPTGKEYVYFTTTEYEEGTTTDPKLVVVHAPPAAGFTSLINTSSVA